MKGHFINPNALHCLQCTISASMSEADLSNSVKNGIMYLEDPVDNEWLPHFFVLTQTQLDFTEETGLDQQEDDEEEDEPLPASEVRV